MKTIAEQYVEVVLQEIEGPQWDFPYRNPAKKDWYDKRKTAEYLKKERLKKAMSAVDKRAAAEMLAPLYQLKVGVANREAVRKRLEIIRVVDWLRMEAQ